VQVVSQRPNVLLILTDDQNTDELQWMPHTRRVLADAGMVMTGALSPHPLCCPARAEMLTGQYAQNNGVQHNHGRHGGAKALKVRRNLGAWLQTAGYQTAFVGKFLNEFGPRNGRPPGWTIWNPMVGGTYSYYGTRFYAENGRRDGRYSVDVVGKDTVAYIRRFARDQRPFFIWSSQVAPHAHARAHGAWGPPLLPPVDPPVRARSPSLSRPSFDVPGVARGVGVGEAGTWSRRYIQHFFMHRVLALQRVDDWVASAVRALEKAGRLDNTYIFFVTDNAYLLGEHGFMGKNVPYEENLRIPMVVRGPGIQPGSRSTLPVTLTDLAPTILRITGATPGVVEDGQSFLSTLHGQAQTWRDTQLIQGGSTKKKTAGWAFRGVRTTRYTYVRLVRTGREILFDRQADPYQMHDVASDPRYALIRAELARRTAALEGCAGQACNPRYGDPGAPRP
jgi:arylsulfatase A-like enzyme